MMTPAAVCRVRASFEQVAPQFDQVAVQFYERLFATLPSARELFKVDLTAQAKHLAAALALIVRNLAILDALEQPLMELGAAHARVGVRDEHYPVARDALIASLAESMGGSWTEDLSADWR